MLSASNGRALEKYPTHLARGVYPNDSVRSGTQGVEIKSTRKRGGAVDTHGGRRQWLCVFVYRVDNYTEPATDRHPMRFTEVYLGEIDPEDFRRNERGELGTPTSTLDRDGIARLRAHWVYLDRD